MSKESRQALRGVRDAELIPLSKDFASVLAWDNPDERFHVKPIPTLSVPFDADQKNYKDGLLFAARKIEGMELWNKAERLGSEREFANYFRDLFYHLMDGAKNYNLENAPISGTSRKAWATGGYDFTWKLVTSMVDRFGL